MRERADHDGAASGPFPARSVRRALSRPASIAPEGTAWPRTFAAAVAAALGAALASTPADALADPGASAPPMGAAPLVAPRPFGALEAEYPGGAHGDADVVLELTIDSSGLVAAARVVRGDEPFGAAALAASPAWRFTPPLRGDERVTARVRAVVHFTEETPVAEQPATAAAAAPARERPSPPSGTPRSGATAPPLEVEVRGQGNVPAASTLTRAEVRLLPGAFGDPFRAIESMPGVTPIASGVPYFYVRGAPPGNVGYYLDGIRVPILFHLGLGPSVVHPALVDRVDLYEGGYPAQYGRFAGAIVSGETKPPTPEFHGEGNIRLVDAGAMVEAPFDGGRGTVLVGGRYGYTALLLELVAPDVQLGYGDYQARASYQLTAKDQVSAFVFGSYDHWATKEDGTFHTLFDTQFHRLDLRYDHALDGGGTMRNAVTLGIDRTALSQGLVLDRMVATRLEITKPLSPEVLGRFGSDVVLDAISSSLDPHDDDPTQASLNSLFPSRDDLTVGVRGDVVIQMGPRLELTPGLRVDLYGSNGASAIGFDPRLAARFAITRDVRLIQADGMASQPPSFFLPGPGLSPALTGGLQRALQTSAAIEVDLPAEVTASVGGFHDAFFDMTDPLSISPTPSHIPSNFAVRADGQSYGLELSVKRKLTSRLGGFFSYTLSRSTRNVYGLVVPSAYDRTHVLDTAATYDFGRGYHAGARVIFYTGAPASPIVSADASAFEHPPRLPPFFRLDVRLEKRWTLGKRAWISLVIEVLNATATKETVGVDCSGQPDPFGASGACTNQVIGPVIIPSIGVEAGF